MKKRYLITLLFSTVLILSCASKKNLYITKPAIFLDEKINIVLYSFVFPKSMTNRIDIVKYLNTEIYADYVLDSFVSNFNAQSSMMNIKTLRDVIGQKDFDTMANMSIMGSATVAGGGTIATNYIPDEFYESMKNSGVNAIMTVESSMSFWSQAVRIKFTLRDLDKKIIWQDNVVGRSRYIISDLSPTKRAFYQTIVNDALTIQKRHQSELYIVIDEALADSVSALRRKAPYMFSTNDILFTQKTFSLTNANYAKEAGI